MNRLIFISFSAHFKVLTSVQLKDLFRVFQSPKYCLKTFQLLSLGLLVTLCVIQAHIAAALEFGNRGSKVVELQQKLYEMEYFYGPITGYYGALTENAVRRFQAKNGLKVDGIAGYNTLAALALTDAITTQPSQPTSLLKLGSRGPQVIELQQNLQVIGYYNESITGFYDRLTQKAVLQFQRDIGLKPDGIVGPLTQAAIESELDFPLPYSLPSIPPSFPERGDIR
ncbi:MAG: peptidoglycan-binding protein [Cyanobacteriota bacterium]|nr:peptidoglycan-binding protein [Cyanobacteriota bacterium]